MAEITTKPLAAVKSELTRQQRAAIEAFGRFVLKLEDAFPQEVVDTSNVAKDGGRA